MKQGECAYLWDGWQKPRPLSIEETAAFRQIAASRGPESDATWARKTAPAFDLIPPLPISTDRIRFSLLQQCQNVSQSIVPCRDTLPPQHMPCTHGHFQSFRFTHPLLSQQPGTISYKRRLVGDLCLLQQAALSVLDAMLELFNDETQPEKSSLYSLFQCRRLYSDTPMLDF